MHNILWLKSGNQTIPVICGGAYTTKEGLLDTWRLFPLLLSRIDAEEEVLWREAVLAHTGNALMPSAQKLFWRTRLAPEQVSWKRMSIFLPILAPNMVPLSRHIPETNQPIMASATPDFT